MNNRLENVEKEEEDGTCRVKIIRHSKFALNVYTDQGGERVRPTLRLG